MTRIVWTERARARRAPRIPEDLVDRPEDRAAGWARWRTLWSRIGGSVEEGRGDTSPEWVEPLRAIAELSRRETPPDTLGPDVATAMIALGRHDGIADVALPLVRDGSGLPAAFEAWLATEGVQSGRRYNPNAVWLAPGSGRLASESRLRAWLLVPSEADYQACRDLAEPHLDSPTGYAVCARFPRETEWAERLARRWLGEADQHRYAGAPLVGVLRDFGLACEVLARATELGAAGAAAYVDLLHGFGEAAVPVLVRALDGKLRSYEVDNLLEALVLVGTEDVAEAIARGLSKKAVRERAREYFERFPDLAGPALAGVKKGRAARFAAELLERMERAASQRDLDEADPEDLPELLRAPPWMPGSERPRRRVRVVEAPGTLDGPEGFSWTDTEREAARAHYWGRLRFERVMTTAEVEEYEAEVQKAEAKGRQIQFGEHHGFQARLPPADAVRLWNAHAPVFGGMLPLRFLAEHEDAAIGGLMRWVERWLGRSTWAVSWATHAYSPRMAVPVARLLRRKADAPHARRWLARHPEAAIAGLLPAAVGPDGRDRKAAERALRVLCARGHEPRIRERAAELGPEVAAAIEATLAWDPIYECPKKPPKMPPTWRPAELTRPRLRNGKALPLAAMELVGAMLKFSPPDPAYAGLAVLAEACDERSLAEMAWDLAVAWENGRAAKRDAWMCWSLLHFADDEVVRRTTPALKSPLVVDVLAEIGTPAAMMELATIAGRGRTRDTVWGGVGHRAEQKLEQIAAGLGLSIEDLDERLTPTLGVGADGTVELDYGRRRFRVGFDEKLEPFVIGDKGRLRVLPRAQATDDDACVERAKTRWSDLREDVRVVALRRITLLERAMLEERTWTVDRFREAWVDHPLIIHVTRRVVWCAHTPDGDRTFRVAEDRTCADVHDEPFELPADALVSVPRPARWPDATLDLWQALFRDYELLSPVRQLDRSVPALTAAERDQSSIERPVVTGLDWVSLRRSLVARGFSGSHTQWSKDLPGDVGLSLAYVVAHGRAPTTASTARVRLSLARGGDPCPFGELPDDVTRDVLELVDAGSPEG